MSFGGIHRSYYFRMGKTSSGLRSMRSRSATSLLSSLRSGGLAGNLLSSGSAISRKSIRSAVSKIIRSDTSDASTVSNKVSGGLTEEYVDALKAQAKEDAEAGTYGKDGKASELRAKQMKKYISPDRDSAIAQVSKLLASSSIGSMGSSTVRLSGLPYTAKISKGWNGTSAEIYDEYGEKFASYDSKSGVWKTVTTKAESQFQTASSSIYDEAYRAASTEKNSNTNKNTSSGLDVRA